MLHAPFSKWDPSGNVTILMPEGLGLPSAALTAWALDPRRAGGEQAGFCDEAARAMRMAGGEFCVNATRCFGAWLALREERAGKPAGEGSARVYVVRVSGWDDPVSLSVEGRAPSWFVTASLVVTLPEPEVPAPGARVLRLPGITHVLVDERVIPLPSDPMAAGREMMASLDLLGEPACGVVWWREGDGGPAITPIVRVRDIDTLFAEKACGSGSMALALLLAREGGGRRFDVRQPSGDALTVTLDDWIDGAMAVHVSGRVRLTLEGTLPIPDGAL